MPPVILLVDDDDGGRYATRRMLTHAGFAVEEAATGQQALAKVRGAPDLVLLDIQLPDLSGLEVCRRIKADPATQGIPVLHLTAACDSSEARAGALEGGADGYLTQPVEPIVLVATIRALLRAREAESHARQLTRWWQCTFDAIGDPVGLLDREGRFLRCNVAMARLFGRSDPDEMVGLSGVPPLPGAAEPEGGWPVQRAVLNRRRESASVSAAGRWYEVVADPVVENDEVTAVVRTVIDVTARKETEQRMAELLQREQAARAEAEHVNRLKDEFLATLSHELRTPLNAIVGWAQLLRQGTTDEATLRRAIEVIVRNARVQEQLITDILDVSRIVAGKLRLEPRSIDLCDVIAQAAETVRPAAEARGIRLVTRVEPGGATIGDPSRLQQVIWNLLANAIKFTPVGGAAEVRLEWLPAAARITVQDDGPGIDPAFLPYVFERFRQADASSTRRHGGLGLGLAIVRHLVEMHGGSVHAHNREGGGAVFQVLLPLRAGAPAGPVPRALDASRTALDQAGPSLGGLTVLVVDDDADARGLVSYVLEKRGARALVAESAARALELLQQERPDVLLADIEMPHQDGYAFIRTVRALPAERGGATPAAALTAYAGAQDRARALESGYQMHLVKPVQPDDLVSVVAALVHPCPVD